MSTRPVSLWSSSLAAAAIALAGLACGGSDGRDAGTFQPNDASTSPDTGTTTPDTGVEDTGVTEPDSGVDGGVTDTGVTDTGVADTGVADTGVDAGMGDPQAQIEAVRAAAVGEQTPALPVQGAIVTYVRAAVGDDPAGFFVQVAMTGPALFVAVDPTTLTPAPVPGDEVGFGVLMTEQVGSQLRVTSIDAFSRLSQGNDPVTLVQELSLATDVVSALDTYESELISISGTLTGAYRFGGAAHSRIQLSTLGLPDEADLSFRAPDDLIGPLGLVPGCDVVVLGTPLWRFNTNAQAQALTRDDVQVIACAGPLELQSAVALNATTVRLAFNRPLDPTTANAAQFALTPSATVQSVMVTDNLVELTVSPLAEFQTYEVTVGGAVTDDLGNAIDPALDTLSFLAPGNAAVPGTGDLVITEFMQNPDGGDDDREWFEIYNPTSTTTYNLQDCVVSDDGSNTATFMGPVPVAPGQYLSVGISQTGTTALGFVPDYIIDNGVAGNSMFLGNGSDELIITCAMAEVDRVAWDNGATFPDPNGNSTSLNPNSLDTTANDDGANWCEGTSMYTMGGFGTPGMANDSCVVVVPDAGVDAGTGMDAGNAMDAGVDGGTNPDAGMVGMTPNGAGQLVITEIFQNPDGSDTDREWFEVYNPSTTVTYDLNGCTFSDSGTNSSTVTAPVAVAPGDFFAIGITQTGTTAWGFTPDYVIDNQLPFNSLFLGNGSDDLIMTCGTVEIDRVAWDNGATFPDPNGATMNLNSATLDAMSNDMGSNWCEAMTLFTATERGTPSLANEMCNVTMPDAGVMDSGAPVDAGATDAGPAVDAGMGASDLLINEVDYDQSGADTMEFLEIYNAGSGSADLTNLAVVMVNGSNDTEYGRYPLSGTLAAGGYLVLGNSAVTVPGGVTFVTLPSNGLQNGGPDGVALIDTSNNTVIDAMTYEGSITAAIITGFTGTVNLTSGTPIIETDTGAESLARLPNGSNVGDDDLDWGSSATPTPGAANAP